MKLTEAVLSVNHRQMASVIERIRRAVPELAGKTIALLGLAFKPDTDDMRDAPALRIISDLQAAGAAVRAYDPAAMDAARQFVADVVFCEDEYEAARDSDALVIVTEWNQFRGLDFNRLKSVMKALNVVDTRNIYEPKDVREAGFAYVSMGRL